MRRRAFLSLLGAVYCGRSLRATTPARHPLMTFPGSDGSWEAVRSAADWARRREAILRAMQEVMGPLPGGGKKRAPLDVKLLEEVDAGSYLRRSITYLSEPGCRVPAYLLIPKRIRDAPRTSAPAALCLHPTDNIDGNKTVVGLGSRENRDYAAELAERGFVTLAPAYPLLGGYQPDLAALGYVSGTMKAIWDNIRGLDLLESLVFVRADRIGAIGHSLGGHNAIFTAVFDERIKAIVSSCGFDSFADYKHGDITGWTSQRYMPRLAEYKNRLDELPFDFDEVLAAVAPRSLFVSAPLRDTNFSAASVDRLVSSADAVFALLGAPEAIVVEHPDCPHDFPKSVREHAYAFLEKTAHS